MSATLGSEIQSSNSRDDRVKTILDVLSTYSPSGGEEKVARLLHENLKTWGLESRIDPVGNVLSFIGKGETVLLLCGHMDTVPGEIVVRLEGDLVRGRGACDAKGALLSLLFAFEELSRDEALLERGRVIFAGVTEEERSSAGLAEIIRQNLRSKYAIFGEPGGLNKITVGYRGHLTARLLVNTKEVHASAPHLSTNSVELVFAIYQRLKESFGAEASESVTGVSASITEISAGTAHNTIPGKANATIDIRVPLGKTTEEMRIRFEKVIAKIQEEYPDASASVSYDEPTEPYSVKLDSSIVRAMNRSILKTGQKPTFIKKSGTGDMNTYASAFGADAVTYGPGEASLSHTPNEKVSIREIFACAKIIVDATKELFEINEKNGNKDGTK